MQDSSKFFKQHPKYGKQHLMAENSYHLREMIEQCSRCSLPTGSGTSDQKSENVKSSVTPMPTNDPIFVMIRFIKTPLYYEKLRTWVTPLRSHINFIVGPTGPNYNSKWNFILVKRPYKFSCFDATKCWNETLNNSFQLPFAYQMENCEGG